jgi:hypothetical protein
MTAYANFIPMGQGGQVVRNQASNELITERTNGVAPIKRFGDPGIYASDGTVRGLVATDTGVTEIAGVSVKGFVDTPVFGQNGFGGTPPQVANKMFAICKRGEISASVVGNPVRGAPVFIWIAATAGANVQGGFQAAASAGNTIAITNWVFGSGKDAEGFATVMNK